MNFVSSASFSILVNGSPRGHIVMSKGFRQGDPLSLYLFLLCTEGLISLLNRPDQEFQIPGIKLCRGAPSINHLLVVDDNVLFCKADVDTTKKV